MFAKKQSEPIKVPARDLRENMRSGFSTPPTSAPFVALTNDGARCREINMLYL